MPTLFRIDDNFSNLFTLLTNDIEYNIKLLGMYYQSYEYDSMNYSMFFHKVFPKNSNEEIKVINLFNMREYFLDEQKTLRISVYTRTIYKDYCEIALYDYYKMFNVVDLTRFKSFCNAVNFVVF